MSTLSARIRQSPQETKRWMLDYTAQLNPGEAVVSVGVSVVPLSNLADGFTPPTPVVVNSIVLGPGGLQAVFYASGGQDGFNYEATFLATTSIGQIFEDVVEIDIMEKA